MTAHAACSPSSAAMWLACPASVTLTRDIPRTSSKYAREGTAAHRVAEKILRGDVVLPDKITVEGEEFIISPGMCRALRSYVAHVQSLYLLPDAEVWLEERVKVPGTRGLVWGTMDCGMYADPYALTVTDLKYGKGHLVHPDAPQLKLYALGLADMVGAHDPKLRVTLAVCQPRIEGSDFLRWHVTTLGSLRKWATAELKPAIHRIAIGDTTESAGPHCRWCVRQGDCKAFNDRHRSRAAEVFNDEADT